MKGKGLGGRKKKVTEEVFEEMRNLRGAGLSKKGIAEKLGLSYQTVFRYLKEDGFFERIKRKMGEVVKVNDVAKGRGGIKTAPTSDMWQGQVFTPMPRARRVLVLGTQQRDRRGPATVWGEGVR